MNHERLERSRRTFDHRFASFNQIQDIDAARTPMADRARKPMATRLEEFPFVEPGALLPA
jgi:hypothetical protein